MMNYFAENLWLFWAIVTVITLICELLVGGFFLLSFSFGALLAVVSAAVGLNFEVQIFVFAISSLLTLFFVRPLALRLLHNNAEADRLSNADAIIGRTGIVSQDIPANNFGRVAIDGDDWKAETLKDLSLPKGTKVEVILRDSLIITVKPVTNKKDDGPIG